MLNLIVSDLKVDALSYLRYSITLDSTLYNTFHIDRMYVNFKGDIFKTDVFKLSFRFTPDIGQIRDVGKAGRYKEGKDSTIEVPKSSIVGAYYVFSKYAFLEATYRNYKLYFGQTYNFWIRTMDRIWDYRFIEKTSNDYFSVISSADLGIAFEYSSKLFRLNLGVFNGEGYNKVEDNKFKDFEAVLSIYPINNEDLEIGIHGYGHFGKYKNEEDKIRGIGAISINQKYFRLGVEYSQFKGSTLTSGDTISSNLISGFVVIKPINMLELFARFDRYKEQDNFILGGFVLKLVKDFRLSLNYKQLKETGTLNLQTEVKF